MEHICTCLDYNSRLVSLCSLGWRMHVWQYIVADYVECNACPMVSIMNSV